MKRLFSRYKSDNSGVMTMEFMVMLPVLLMWFAATFVFFDAFHKWMKALKATYTVSDMLSRQGTITDASLIALDNVFDTLTQSKNPGLSWIRVTSIQQNEATGLEVLWSASTGSEFLSSTGASDSTLQEDIERSLNGLEKGETIVTTGTIASMVLSDIAARHSYLEDGQSLFIVETSRAFIPLFDWVGLNVTSFTNRIAVTSRFSSDLKNSDRPPYVYTGPEGIVLSK